MDVCEREALELLVLVLEPASTPPAPAVPLRLLHATTTVRERPTAQPNSTNLEAIEEFITGLRFARCVESLDR